MPREVRRGRSTRGDDSGVIKIGKKKCPSKDGPSYETKCVASGTAKSLVAAGRAAADNFKTELRDCADAVRKAAHDWAEATDCTKPCVKRGSIVGPVDWDFPDIKEDLSKSPKSFTVTISTVVRCSATVLCG